MAVGSPRLTDRSIAPVSVHESGLQSRSRLRCGTQALLKSKIDAVFGHSFNVNGLGGVLTCGKTGLAAGLSHAPICAGGRERYAFFAFPHIGVNEAGRPQVQLRAAVPLLSCRVQLASARPP